MNIISIPGFSEPFSSLSHLLAAFVFTTGGFFIIHRGRGNFFRLFGLSIYTFSLLFLFSMSGVYHLLDPSGTPRMIFQRLDHAGIYILIAGSFTAIHFVFFNGKKRWFPSTFIWILAIVGLVLTVIFFDSIPQWLLCAFYLGLGWPGIVTGYLLHKHYGRAEFSWLIYGGVIYSLGALVMYFDWPVIWPGVIGAHEVFHIAVVVAASFHWYLIYKWASNPSSSKLTFVVKKRPNGIFYASALNETFYITGTSPEDIKSKIGHCIDDNYHPSMKPVSVCIKTFDEDLFHIQ